MYRTEHFSLEDGSKLVFDVYDEHARPDRLVVYLHGLLLDSDLNRGIAAALAARGNRVVLLDCWATAAATTRSTPPLTGSTPTHPR